MALSKFNAQLADSNQNPLIGPAQTFVANASVAYTTGGLDTEAKIIAATNTTNGKINSILAILIAHGLMKAS